MATVVPLIPAQSIARATRRTTRLRWRPAPFRSAQPARSLSRSLRRRLRRAATGVLLGGLTTALVAGSPVAARAHQAALPDTIEASLRAASAANVAHDVARQRALLEHAATLAGWPAAKSQVQRQLALVEWRYYLRDDQARARLEAETHGPNAADAWVSLARMEMQRGDAAAARRAIEQALRAAGSTRVPRAVRIRHAEAAVEEAAAQRRAGQSGRTDALPAALDALRTLVRERPGSLPESRLLLRAGLLLGRPDEALAGWRSYHHVAPGRPLPNAIADAGAQLELLLPALAVGSADPGARVDLVLALAGARFMDEAALMALDPQFPDSLRTHPQIRVLLVYNEAIRRLALDAADYYRRLLLGDDDADSLTAAVRSAAMQVWTAVYGNVAAPPTSDAELHALLEQRFGAAIRLARSPRTYDLHMGHSIIDETRTIEQYGRRADVRFVQLDTIVSQGFTDWAWEGRTGTRGLTSGSTIYQFRPSYVPETLWAWEVVSNPRTRARWEERTAEQRARDDDLARANPYAFLPGLAQRLEHQGRLELLEELQAQGFEGDLLRAAFMGDYERAVQASSIFAHEGRHAMDIRDQVRYRREVAAKLSEVAFAPRPRLALTGIIHANIGTDTPHGRSNLVIIEGLVAWIEANREQIAGFDPTRPSLPQFDRLTDEQIRAAFRSMDPYLQATTTSR